MCGVIMTSHLLLYLHGCRDRSHTTVAKDSICYASGPTPIVLVTCVPWRGTRSAKCVLRILPSFAATRVNIFILSL